MEYKPKKLVKSKNLGVYKKNEEMIQKVDKAEKEVEDQLYTVFLFNGNLHLGGEIILNYYGKNNKLNEDVNSLYCCKIKEKLNYIACDSCENWYHAECI